MIENIYSDLNFLLICFDIKLVNLDYLDNFHKSFNGIVLTPQIES